MKPTLRRRAFWLVCIPLRAYLTYAARLSRKGRKLLRVFALAISYRWLRGLEVGNEGVFGGPAWWADSRKMHGQLWGAFAITGNWRFLAVDTAAGVANYFISGPGTAIWPSLQHLHGAADEIPREVGVLGVADAR